MSHTPTLSVVLAAVDSADRAADAVARLTAWTTERVEFVLVDDGSIDSTRSCFLEAAERDPRVRVIVLPSNEGLGSARRAGFRAARGQYVWNVDVDDEWSSEGGEALLEAIRGGADIVLAAARRRSITGDERVIPAVSARTGAEALAALFTGDLSGHLWNKAIARRLFTDQDYTGIRIQSDLIMLLPVLARAQTVARCDAVVYCYVENAGSSIRSRRPRGDGVEEIARRAALAAREVGLADTESFRQFLSTHVTLSGLRDAVIADYTPAESSRRFALARADIRVSDLGLLLRRGKARAAALLALAVVSPWMFRSLIGGRARQRDAMSPRAGA